MDLIKCEWCEGTGEVLVEVDWEVNKIECTNCEGTGKIKES